MTHSLAGRIALVTGAGGGIGRDLIQALADAGARAVATDLPGALTATVPGATLSRPLDVADASAWDAVVEEVERTLGGIDILVNNAGVGSFGTVFDHRVDDFRRVMDVNVLGTYNGLRAVVPGMVARGRGSVINMSSIAGVVGRPDGMAYTASKWAIRGLTKTVALDLAHTPVRVNCVNPGIIRTPMTDGISPAAYATQPIDRLGEPREVTAVVLFLASDAASFCTGADFDVDGGYSTGMIALRPRQAYGNSATPRGDTGAGDP